MSPLLAGFAGGAGGTEGAGTDAALGEPADEALGPEATEESPQPFAAMASAPAKIQIARFFIIIPLSYGHQAQAFCQNHRNGERSRT